MNEDLICERCGNNTFFIGIYPYDEYDYEFISTKCRHREIC